jgi:SAM-dependent methyltransferase
MARPPSAASEPDLDTELAERTRLVDSAGHPNINALWAIAKDIEGIKLNIKAFGYDLGRRLVAAHGGVAPPAPVPIGLTSKASTQADMESAWMRHWCGRLGIAPLYNRKIWEFGYLLQAVWEAGLLAPGARGLGFGCGEEPIPAFLAAVGCRVTMTDLDPHVAAGKGWVETGQHASSLEKGYKAHLVDRATYVAQVEHAYVDMTDIPPFLHDYDFCWSLCSLEHLGSIRRGLDFIENSLATLRPGGVAVHTTEFNFMKDETIDNWPTVLLQRRHFEELAARLSALGHRVAPLDFDTGDGPMDRFIDLPPFTHDLTGASLPWAKDGNHLKLLLDGIPATCFGLVVTKAT